MLRKWGKDRELEGEMDAIRLSLTTDQWFVFSSPPLKLLCLHYCDYLIRCENVYLADRSCSRWGCRSAWSQRSFNIASALLRRSFSSSFTGGMLWGPKSIDCTGGSGGCCDWGCWTGDCGTAACWVCCCCDALAPDVLAPEFWRDKLVGLSDSDDPEIQ